MRETEKLIKILKNPKKTAKKEKIEHTFIYETGRKNEGNHGDKGKCKSKSNGKGKIEIRILFRGRIGANIRLDHVHSKLRGVPQI